MIILLVSRDLDSNRVLRSLHSPQILNGLLLSKDFEQGEITNSLHPQKREVCQNDPGNEFEGDHFCSTCANPAMVRSRSDTGAVIYGMWP